MNQRPHQLVLGITVTAWMLATGSLAHASHPSPPLGVEFTGCVESIGVGLAPTDNVLALTPAGFIPVGIGTPVSPIVVRTADCAGISVEGSKPKPGSVVQIGAVIVPPQFTGEDIDNYTFWYYTTDAKLAHRLQDLGVAARHVATIRYDLDPEEPGVSNDLTVTVPRPADPRFTLTGTVAPSTTPSGSFRSSWWQRTAVGNVRMDTTVPVIAIGGANLTLATTPGNALSALIGGTTLGFPIIQQFNLFPVAPMSVDVVP